MNINTWIARQSSTYQRAMNATCTLADAIKEANLASERAISFERDRLTGAARAARLAAIAWLRKAAELRSR